MLTTSQSVDFAPPSGGRKSFAVANRNEAAAAGGSVSLYATLPRSPSITSGLPTIPELSRTATMMNTSFVRIARFPAEWDQGLRFSSRE